MERLTRRTDSGKIAYALCGPGECVDVIDLLHVWGESLAAYEDTGLEPEKIQRIVDEYGRGMTLRTSCAERLEIIRDIPTDVLREVVKLYQQADVPNPPLTLEELRKMDGCPVWVEFMFKGYESVWMLVNKEQTVAFSSKIFCVDFSLYGKTWLAYRRKPEEGD